ncbi:hypothetical protein FOA52_013470 [Chlamydomonas sp. UWO 241]|nr:hypothetical protein FOA52_013470 [Chlamydomonas sp. UWO 241]
MVAPSLMKSRCAPTVGLRHTVAHTPLLRPSSAPWKACSASSATAVTCTTSTIAPIAAPRGAAIGSSCMLRQNARASNVKTAAASGSMSAAAPVDDGKSSFMQAVFNVVNVIMGVGLLTLPFALKSSGWVGLGLLWVMGIITNYTGKALVECAQKVAEKQGLGEEKVLGYEDIAEAAFGKIGRLLISSIIYTELFGTCCLLFILEGDNLFQLLGTSSG